MSLNFIESANRYINQTYLQRDTMLRNQYASEASVYGNWTSSVRSKLRKFTPCSERLTQQDCESSVILSERLSDPIYCGWNTHWFGNAASCAPQRDLWERAAKELESWKGQPIVLPFHAFISDILYELSDTTIDISRLVSKQERLDIEALQFYFLYKFYQAAKVGSPTGVVKYLQQNSSMLRTVLKVFVEHPYPFSTRLKMVQNLMSFPLQKTTTTKASSSNLAKFSIWKTFLLSLALGWNLPGASASLPPASSATTSLVNLQVESVQAFSNAYEIALYNAGKALADQNVTLPGPALGTELSTTQRVKVETLIEELSNCVAYVDQYHKKLDYARSVSEKFVQPDSIPTRVFQSEVLNQIGTELDITELDCYLQAQGKLQGISQTLSRLPDDRQKKLTDLTMKLQTKNLITCVDSQHCHVLLGNVRGFRTSTEWTVNDPSVLLMKDISKNLMIQLGQVRSDTDQYHKTAQAAMFSSVFTETFSNFVTKTKDGKNVTKVDDVWPENSLIKAADLAINPNDSDKALSTILTYEVQTLKSDMTLKLQGEEIRVLQHELKEMAADNIALNRTAAVLAAKNQLLGEFKNHIDENLLRDVGKGVERQLDNAFYLLYLIFGVLGLGSVAKIVPYFKIKPTPPQQPIRPPVLQTNSIGYEHFPAGVFVKKQGIFNLKVYKVVGLDQVGARECQRLKAEDEEKLSNADNSSLSYCKARESCGPTQVIISEVTKTTKQLKAKAEYECFNWDQLEQVHFNVITTTTRGRSTEKTTTSKRTPLEDARSPDRY